MSNSDKDSKLFIGLLIGGAVGVGALAVFLATRKDKAPLSSIGEAIIHIGEILDNHDIKEPAAMKRVEKKIHAQESSIANVVDWIATGINIWKQMKR